VSPLSKLFIPKSTFSSFFDALLDRLERFFGHLWALRESVWAPMGTSQWSLAVTRGYSWSLESAWNPCTLNEKPESG
jgi:hypothetical protein